MSVFGDAIGAIEDALQLAEDVERSGETLKDISRELREDERRITRVEAKCEAAVELSGTSARSQARGTALSTMTCSAGRGAAAAGTGLRTQAQDTQLT
jgi:hypothetical protein